MTLPTRSLAGLLLASALPFAAVGAQTAEDFDESRAYIGEEPMFEVVNFLIEKESQ